MLQLEVGVLDAHQVKTIKGGLGKRKYARRLCGWVWVFWPRLGLSLTFFFRIGYTLCAVMLVGSLVSLVSHTGFFQPGEGVFLALEQEGLSVT